MLHNYNKPSVMSYSSKDVATSGAGTPLTYQPFLRNRSRRISRNPFQRVSNLRGIKWPSVEELTCGMLSLVTRRMLSQIQSQKTRSRQSKNASFQDILLELSLRFRHTIS